MKQCRRCRQTLSAGGFRPDSRLRDGLSSWCIQCHRQRASEWAKENRLLLNGRSAAWRAANPEKARASNVRFKRANADRLKSDYAAWARDNAALRAQSTAQRKAAKLRATPLWANRDAIAELYRAAAARRAMGERVHVDHIVPLQGSTVCGLHCEANLEIIPGAENEGKRNRWWPDMFNDAQRQGSLFGEAA